MEEDGELWLPFVAGLLVCPLLVTGLGAGGVDWTHLFFDGGGVKGGGDLAACLSLIFLQLCSFKCFVMNLNHLFLFLVLNHLT